MKYVVPTERFTQVYQLIFDNNFKVDVSFSIFP